RLRWAIGNLVDNSIKYTPPGGTIVLEVRGEEANYAQLRLRDNGVGILADEQPHLFTRFWRGTPTLPDGRVLRAPGMGQGLHVVKRILEMHGGALQIRSKPGVGTAVYFRLPLTASESFDLPQLYANGLEGDTMPMHADATQPIGVTRLSLTHTNGNHADL
ncbi:MAG: ATP-binding protein, partial [Armatimonadetes bacterium]|nr:ATP-binding protein [Anaerolineae bacterium]